MKLIMDKKVLTLIPEVPFDHFTLGIISSKTPNILTMISDTDHQDSKIQSMSISKEDLIKVLMR